MFVNKSGQTISISDIPTSWLCPNCWTLIDDYCRGAEKIDEIKLNPIGDQILSEIMSHSQRTRNPILKALSKNLRVKIRAVLNHPDKKNNVFQLLMKLASEGSVTRSSVSI